MNNGHPGLLTKEQPYIGLVLYSGQSVRRSVSESVCRSVSQMVDQIPELSQSSYIHDRIAVRVCHRLP